MKKIIYFSTIIGLLFIIACSEEFTTNTDETLEDVDAFFLEESNVEEALIGVYDIMQQNYNGVWSNPFFMKVLPGDIGNAGGSNSSDQLIYQNIDQHTSISTSNSAIETTWNLFYRTIALSNLIINKLEGSTLSNKERVTAEAKFLRAWSYFELTTMFGGVPLRITLPENAEDFALAKSPQSDVYAQIEADLLDAIAGLTDKSSVSDDFRVSSGAAQALMGKVLVFQERYSESIPYFQAVINNSSHDLEPNFADVWSVNSEFGIESLVEIGYISTGGITWDNIPWGGRMESNLHIQLMGPRGDGIFGLGDTGLINGWGFNYPSDKAIEKFEASGDSDARKAETLLTEDELIALGGSVDQSAADGGEIWGYEGAIRTKYATKTEDTSDVGQPELNYTTNYRLLRYGEVLLLAAEAYNKAGQDAEARTELNKIRQRAGLADVDASLAGENLFEAIVEEKFLELAHEGQRFWDLVRWGKASEELSEDGYTSKNDLFPIPIAEIDKNTAMSADDQNPGY